MTLKPGALNLSAWQARCERCGEFTGCLRFDMIADEERYIPKVMATMLLCNSCVVYLIGIAMRSEAAYSGPETAEAWRNRLPEQRALPQPTRELGPGSFDEGATRKMGGTEQ